MSLMNPSRARPARPGVRYDARLVGLVLLLMPAVAALGFIGLAALFTARGVTHSFTSLFLVATLEACLPLTVAVTMATLVVRDAALELQLTVKTPYPVTMVRRCALVLGCALLSEWLASLIISWFFPWALPISGLSGILIWAAPTLWLAGTGVVLALLMGSRTTSIALLGCVWVVQLAVHGYFLAYGWTRPWFLFTTTFAPAVDFWLANRLELLGAGVLGLLVAWRLLHNAEWRFRREDV